VLPWQACTYAFQDASSSGFVVYWIVSDAQRDEHPDLQGMFSL